MAEDEYHIELPRTMFGGLKKSAVEQLLRRIADDYERLDLEKQRLAEKIELLDAPKADPGGGVTDVQPPSTDGPIAAERHESDELAAAVLAVAQRTAREMRQSAREECELMLRKSRARASKIEEEAALARATANAEIEQLDELKSELREHMRASLRALLSTFVAERSGGLPALDWNDIPGLVHLTTGDTKDHRSKRKKKSSR